MKCPACQSELIEVDLGELKVDICQKGCGGVWFDRFELDKTSSPHASSINNLLNNTKATELTITENKRLCPRDSTFMMQHFYSVKKQVKVDTCPRCAGIWLDRNELNAIQSEYKNACEKKQDANDYLEKAFRKILAYHQYP